MVTLYLDRIHKEHKIELIEPLGNEGRSGVVFKANSSCYDNGQSYFAVKIYDQDIDQRTQGMILDLINSSLQDVGNLFLPKVKVVDETGIIRGYAMAYAKDCVTLSTFYASTERSNLSLTVNFAIQLCELVDRVHTSGYVIGDLSASNILVNEEGDLIIIDCDSFGTASSPAPFVPVPEYSTPEGGKVTKEHDLFLLGLHLVYLLYGVHPFFGSKNGEKFTSIESNIKHYSSWLCNRELNLPIDITLNFVPKSIEYLLLQILSKKPSDRHISLRQLTQELTSHYIKKEFGGIKSEPMDTKMVSVAKKDVESSVSNEEKQFFTKTSSVDHMGFYIMMLVMFVIIVLCIWIRVGSNLELSANVIIWCINTLLGLIIYIAVSLYYYQLSKEPASEDNSDILGGFTDFIELIFSFLIVTNLLIEFLWIQILMLLLPMIVLFLFFSEELI